MTVFSPRSKFSVVLAAACGLFAASAASADVKPGDSFPPLATAGLEGNLPATAGQVVLVDFWASWCTPCRASFPAYARLQGDYGGRGLVIVAVSVDQTAAAYARFVRQLHPPFPTVRDGGQKLVSAVNVPTMPSSYLVGRDGKVRFVHAGFYGDRTERELRREIESLLREKAPSS
jgi:thiol-disulfide isomerase/thioredoxin